MSLGETVGGIDVSAIRKRQPDSNDSVQEFL